MSTNYEVGRNGRTRYGNMAEWLRRLIRNQLEAIPREFESLCCRLFCADFWPSLGEQNPRGAARTEV